MGYGAEIAAQLADKGFEHLDAPIRRLTGLDVPSVPFSHPMQEYFLPNPDRIADAIRELAEY
jgi:2-oxoisovalerate dehydrogenase E1 component beta subunit